MRAVQLVAAVVVWLLFLGTIASAMLALAVRRLLLWLERIISNMVGWVVLR